MGSKSPDNQTLYYHLIENLNDGLYITDAQGIFTFINPSMAEILGYTDEEDIISRSIFEFLIPENVPKLKKQFMDNMSKGYTSEKITTKIVRRDKTIAHIEIRPTSIIENGKPIANYGVVRDMTERELSKEKLMQLNHELKEIIATKNKMVSIIAHDLKSPFNSIIGFSELLTNAIQNNDLQNSLEYSTIIYSTATRTLTLLENLLAWAIMQSGKFDFNPEIVHLRSFICKLIDDVSSSARIKDIEITCFDEEMDVYADPLMLRLILENLINNAIKFSEIGGRVNVYALSKGNETEIIVKDNGVGISDELKSRLFTDENWITTNGTAAEKGSGLGLLLCKEFVEMHRGKIKVESKKGLGSKFIFTLPQHTKA